jgi:hypothetical protein
VKDNPMIRKTLQRLLVVLVAVLSVSSMAEAAAGKKVVHPRPRHSSRVVSGARTSKKATATTKSGAATVKKPAAPQRKPTTKPR